MNPILAFTTAILCITIATPLTISTPHDPWVTAVDSRTGPDWISATPQRLYSVRDGRAVAIDASSGTVLWRASFSATSAPAAHGNDLAVPTHNGVAFLDGRGVKKGFFRASGSATVASVAANIVGVIQGRSDSRSCTLFGYRSKKILFSLKGLDFCDGRLFTFGGDAVGITNGDGIMVYDGRNGKAVAQITGVDQLVGIDGRMLWFSVVNGGIKGVDLDTTRTITMHSGIIKDAVSVEHGIAVAVVDGRLQTVDLLHGSKTAPLKIIGRWVGGPINRKILVERSDGLYLQSLTSGAKAIRVAKYSGESRYITSDRRTVIAAVSDGTIYVIDTERSKQIAAIPTSCRIFEGFSASGKTTVSQCDDARGASHLIGFNRYITSSSMK